MEPPSGRDGARLFAAETYFSGCLVWCDVPRAAAAALLPAGLSLGLAPGRGGSRHPVVFVFGEHDRSAVLFATMRFPTGVRFHEMVVAVPFVRTPGDATPAVFLPTVFSSDAIATWSGKVHYGYRKRRVPLEWLGHSFVVSDERGRFLAQVSCAATGAWAEAATSRLPALRTAAAFGAMPVIGFLDDGRLVRSSFAWGFDGGRIRQIAARVDVAPPLVHALGIAAAHGLPARCLEIAALRWRISWPNP